MSRSTYVCSTKRQTRVQVLTELGMTCSRKGRRHLKSCHQLMTLWNCICRVRTTRQKVWLQPHKADVVVPDPEETGGWQATDCRLEVVWLRKPSVPSSCLEVVRLLVDANASAAHKLAVATRWDNHVYLHVTVLLKDA